MKRIALVNQRYGIDVNGGSEYYTRLIAERLAAKYEVEVLTSCAKDYDTWENVYEEGIEIINGITVRRFATVRNRRRLSQKISGKLLTFTKAESRGLNHWWIYSQGPYVPGMLEYLRKNKERYDKFIFVTYLYYTTALGMPEVADKAIFIPTAHEEFCINFPIYRQLFFIPKASVYLTEEERDIVWNKFHNESKRFEVMGVGIELPKERVGKRFRKKYGINNEFFLYIGRVDENKGCGEMAKFFRSFLAQIKNRYSEEEVPHLVIMGQEFMKISSDPHIHSLGFVSDEDKYDAIDAAKLLWLPSEFESLSLSVLEAMASGTPVVVNGKCKVLKGHCDRSKGGLYYENEKECHMVLEKFLGNSNKEEYKEYCICAQKYIANNYSWQCVLDKFEKLIEE